MTISRNENQIDLKVKSNKISGLTRLNIILLGITYVLKCQIYFFLEFMIKNLSNSSEHIKDYVYSCLVYLFKNMWNNILLSTLLNLASPSVGLKCYLHI